MIEFYSLEQRLIPDENSSASGLPYIHCNEQNQADCLEPCTGVQIGFSVWFNLDLLAENRAACAIILDKDPSVYKIYQLLQTAFSQADSREEFVKLFGEMIKKEFFQQAQLELAELQNDLRKGFGFLSSPEKFTRVKKLIAKKQVFFGCADLMNTEHVILIKDWCDSHGFANTDRLSYFSNIAEWVLQDPFKKGTLVQNIRLLTTENTRLIDAFYPTPVKKGSGPPLRVSKGKVPNFDKVPESRFASRRMGGDGGARFKKNLMAEFQDQSKHPEEKMLSHLQVELDPFGASSAGDGRYSPDFGELPPPPKIRRIDNKSMSALRSLSFMSSSSGPPLQPTCSRDPAASEAPESLEPTNELLDVGVMGVRVKADPFVLEWEQSSKEFNHG